MTSFTLLGLTSDKTILSGFSKQLVVPWDCATKQAGLGLWSPASPTKIIMPAGVSAAVFTCGIAITHNNVGDRQAYLRKNGNEYPPGYISDIRPAALTSASGQSWTSTSAIMDVCEGDYFELVFYQDSGVPISLRALGSTWFQCKIEA